MGRPGSQPYYYVVQRSGTIVSRHKTVTAAAKRIKRDHAVGQWGLKVDGILGLRDIGVLDRGKADEILYPALHRET